MKTPYKISNTIADAYKYWDMGKGKKAFSLFYSAAEQGEQLAYNTVGYFYDHGIGVKKDPQKAYVWYRRAAREGDIVGYSNLAIFYRDKGNLQRAKFWFKKAYAQGDGSAAYELGAIYSQQNSSISRKRALQFLNEAIASDCITDVEREQANDLLLTLKSIN